MKPPPMNAEQNATSPLPLEFYLGTALGFLLASLMLNASYGGLAGLYPIPVLGMSLAGFIVGKIRQRFWKKTITSLQYFKYRFRFFVLLLLCCALGPYCTMKTYYWVQATNIPVPPGWTRISVQTTVLGWDNGAGFRVRIEGHDTEGALQFYREYFEKKGWSDRSDRSIMSSGSRAGSAFTYGDARSSTWIYFGIRDYQYQPGQKRIIYVSRME